MPLQRKRRAHSITCSRCQAPAPPAEDPERDYWMRLDIHGMQACHTHNSLCGPCTWNLLIFMNYAPNRKRGIEFVDAQFDRYQQRYGATPEKLGNTDTTMH